MVPEVELVIKGLVRAQLNEGRDGILLTRRGLAKLCWSNCLPILFVGALDLTIVLKFGGFTVAKNG